MSAPADEPASPAPEDLVAAIVREANALLFQARKKFVQDMCRVDELMQTSRAAGHRFHGACEAADKARDAARTAAQADWDAERGAGLALREGAQDQALSDFDYSARRALASVRFVYENHKAEAAHFEAITAAKTAFEEQSYAPFIAQVAAMHQYMRVVLEVAECLDDEDMRRDFEAIAAVYFGANCKEATK